MKTDPIAHKQIGEKITGLISHIRRTRRKIDVVTQANRRNTNYTIYAKSYKNRHTDRHTHTDINDNLV